MAVVYNPKKSVLFFSPLTNVINTEFGIKYNTCSISELFQTDIETLHMVGEYCQKFSHYTGDNLR